MAPYYFSLKEIDLGPSLYNHRLKIGSYVPIGYYIKVLKDSHLSTIEGLNNRQLLNTLGLI